MKNDGMDEMNIREYLENHKLLTDGAMGTYLDTVEKENYICSEEANITNPSLVRQIHKNYVKNGAQLLRSNTFLANRETLLSLQKNRAEQVSKCKFERTCDKRLSTGRGSCERSVF